MTRVSRMACVLMGIWWLGGCRTATQVKDVPRVDLVLEGGNRGYLVGSAPPAASLKTTRQMVETTIELPSRSSAARRTAGPAGAGDVPPAAAAAAGEESPTTSTQRYDAYVVQKGDSLWSIAAKPDVYGKATRWRDLFEANRDLLKSPNHLRAGMTLKIPRGEERADAGDWPSSGGDVSTQK